MREGKLPLRTVLQNFINHVDTLETKRCEGEDQYEQEFQELKLLTESLKTRTEYACREGERDVNKRKNRYKDILPYDYTRVVLSPYPGIPGSDYINANYIRGASGSRAYIGSQGPLPHTVPDFWRMVVECEVQVIIMASNETEGGKHKCECYWVNGENEERQFGNVTVVFIKARQVCPDFIVRTLKIKYTTDAGKNEERTICQFHYVLWPDHGVPSKVVPLLGMVRLVRDCQASETLPVLVHCSAGCGRTGTICAIDYVWGLLRAGRLTENLNLFSLVKDMRRQRVAMVQTREQYILLHRAVRELFRERLKVIDAHPYENIATDGTPLILVEKESDYEELYVKPEKQDESAKPKPPTTAPSVVSTPTGSLTRYTQSRPNTDYLASSSPMSTLERSLTAGPPLPHKFSKTPPSAMQGSPVPQPSPLLTQSSPLPQASPVSFPSPSQAQISYASPTSQTFQSSLPQSPQLLRKSNNLGSHGSLSHSFSNHDLDAYFGCKLGMHPHSKLEKEAENAAHKRQVTQPSLSSPAEIKKGEVTPTIKGSPQIMSSSSVTPSSTPHHTATPLQGVRALSAQNLSSPQSSSKSRTPSPRITYRRPVESHTDVGIDNESCQSDDDAGNKSTEIVRRPSIAKLKELFEKSAELEVPGVRLSRSASSVTSRTGLSVHPDSEGGFRIKRKSSLGAEETLQSKKAYEIIEKSRQQSASAPLPHPSLKTQTTTPVTFISAAKPPSSPVSASPITRRRMNHAVNDLQEDGSTSALLARVDDRPALPVKKSKSFRYARPINAATNTIASTRSPELARKKADINTYFSLDRGKGEVSVMTKSESGSVNFIGDIPSPREGFKLSVYQMPNAVSSTTSSSMSQSMKEGSLSETRVDGKPQIPPKRMIGERFKSNRLNDFLTPPQPYIHMIPVTYSQSTTVNQNSHTRPHQTQLDRSIYDCPKELQDALKNDTESFSHTQTSAFSKPYTTQSPVGESRQPSRSYPSPKSSPTSDTGQESTTAKAYVNARVMRKPNTDARDSPRFVYVPLPTKRSTREKQPHEYANCDLVGQSQADSTEEDIHELYMDPHILKKGTSSKFPLYDEVSPSSPSKSESSLTKSLSGENLSQNQSSSTPTLASTPGSTADYEVMDFGESIASVDEVFETVNYELLGSKERRGQKNVESKKDFYSKKELDPIAKQVYQDCQEYLLHGNNKSPVPSLMPKPQDKSPDASVKSFDDMNISKASLDISMDVDEVKSKVNVAPQGLRTRERRNSYRQAVNPIIQNEGKLSDDKSRKSQEQTKSIHKYETIWFENGKHILRRSNGSPTSQERIQQNISPSGIQNKIESIPYPKASSSVYMKVQPPIIEDHGPNFNQKSSSKDAQFREKLEELHTLVNNLERQKPGQLAAMLPRYVDDDDHSKGSGSSNSTLQSRSTSSSRSMDPQEPIYANTHMLAGFQSPPGTKPQQLPPRSVKHQELIEARSPPPLRHCRTEIKLDTKESKSGRQSPLLNGSSLYGTIATTTFRGKQPDNAPPPFQNTSPGKPSSSYQNQTTATLPARATLSTSPYHNIPPPKGFGSGTSPSISPNPTQNIQQNRENRDPTSVSPYYNMSAFVSGRPGQSAKPGLEIRQGGKSPYSNIPTNSAVMRSRFPPPPQPTKAHIVGDIAFVGDESVRLRRPGPSHMSRSDCGSSSESRGSDGTPVAPPRIKRNSGLPRSSALDPPASHQDRRSSGAQDYQRQSIITTKQGWSGNNEEPPPAIPAKTAAAYQYPDPPPPPPHHHPHPHHPSRHPPPPPHHPHPTHHPPYMQPPPPKPVQPPHHPHPQIISPSTAYQSNKSTPPSQNHKQNSHPPPQEHSVKISSTSEPFPIPKQLQSDQTQDIDREEITSNNESGSESSDDEGIFHKFSAPNFLKKWRTNVNKQITPTASSPPKSAFYLEREIPKDIKPVKEQPKETATVSPTSPKPLVKALGKLKMNSKSVAANFKSYLSQRGEKGDGEGSAVSGSPQNGRPGGTLLSSPTMNRGLQKSASTGPIANPFTQVVQEYKYPTPIPKKPGGPVEMPESLRSSEAPGPGKTKPRQQYL